MRSVEPLPTSSLSDLKAPPYPQASEAALILPFPTFGDQARLAGWATSQFFLRSCRSAPGARRNDRPHCLRAVRRRAAEARRGLDDSGSTNRRARLGVVMESATQRMTGNGTGWTSVCGKSPPGKTRLDPQEVAAELRDSRLLREPLVCTVRSPSRPLRPVQSTSPGAGRKGPGGNIGATGVGFWYCGLDVRDRQRRGCRSRGGTEDASFAGDGGPHGRRDSPPTPVAGRSRTGGRESSPARSCAFSRQGPCI